MVRNEQWLEIEILHLARKLWRILENFYKD